MAHSGANVINLQASSSACNASDLSIARRHPTSTPLGSPPTCGLERRGGLQNPLRRPPAKRANQCGHLEASRSDGALTTERRPGNRTTENEQRRQIRENCFLRLVLWYISRMPFHAAPRKQVARDRGCAKSFGIQGHRKRDRLEKQWHRHISVPQLTSWPCRHCEIEPLVHPIFPHAKS